MCTLMCTDQQILSGLLPGIIIIGATQHACGQHARTLVNSAAKTVSVRVSGVGCLAPHNIGSLPQ